MERIVETGKQHEPTAAAIGHSRSAAPSTASLPPELQLQQMVGNQAMQEFLRSGYIQAKLAISNPDDPEEREADSVASTIMRKAAGAPSSSPCACSQDGEMCEECQQKQSQPTISRRASAPSAPSHVPRIVSDVLRSPGHPLDSAARAFFEPRFGHDFSHVRIHTDSVASASARSINAHAYTAGSDIVFGPGQYSPGTTSGRSLLAHELTHVLHQTGSDALIQRRVRESVLTDFQPGAQACLVHLHGDEQNARVVGRELRYTHCINFVDLSNASREIHVDLPSGSCTADPNRIFTASGLASNALVTCVPAQAAAARSDLQSFRDSQLAPAITACRGGSGNSLAGPLPIAALHNNTALSVRRYEPGGVEAGAAETDPARLGGRANPTLVPGQNPADFLLATQSADFTAIGATRNVVLQSTTPTDDGSLSVALRNDRYINVEKEGKAFHSSVDPQYVTNRAMALEVLALFGVGKQPCQQAGQAGSVPPSSSAPVPEDETFWGRLWQFFESLIRALQNLSTMPDPLPREAAPARLPAACKTFSDLAALDARKAFWITFIATMPLADVIKWIVGTAAPPAAAARESRQQMDCLLFALKAAAARPGSSIHIPSGSLIQSSTRGFADQQRIWHQKFNFTFPKPFDRISDHARSVCGSLLSPADRRWESPSNPAHRACWGVSSSTPVPPGARSLTDDEKQQEILQASSAPGISRHHWGTEFDILDPDMDPEKWEAGKPFADDYAWLIRNASTYGFMQAFSATSAIPGPGYMEERWHWSYYPIAQALLEVARSHQAAIATSLSSAWGASPEFSYIRRHSRDFMFNVSERPIF